MREFKTDVLIIGAGPTGLALAAQLIRYDVDFLIIDKNETTTLHSKAIGVHARTLEIYDQLDIAETLINTGSIAETVRVVEGGKVRGAINLKDVGVGMSPFPFLLIVEQGKHEKVIYDLITSRKKNVRWNTTLENFSQNKNTVLAKIKNENGEIESVETKFLVGCDGASSFVRHSLGLGFEGGTFERLFYVADVQIDWNFAHDSLYVCLSKNSATVFFPMAGDERNYRIVGIFPEGHDKDENEILYEEIERQIVFDTQLELDITAVNWFSVYKVHSRSVERFSSGRCFLAGDSAHIHTPVGAQGMNTGIQDGYNLAWKLDAVLNHNAHDSLLETYNEERLPNARRLLRTTDRFFRLGAGDGRFTAFVRTNIVPYVAGFALGLDIVRRVLFPLVSQIGINYRDSSLSYDNAGLTVKAGDRMPYLMLEGASIYDLLRAARFHLLIFSDGVQEELTPAESLIAKYGGVLDTHNVPLYPEVVRVFGTGGSFMVLVRPDNYIGMIASGNSIEEVERYLDRIFG